MARPSLQTVRTAKANVARWFADTPAGAAFLPGDGRALPVAADEATAIRASAETRIAETRRMADRRAVATGVVLVLGVTAIYRRQEELEAALGIALDWLPYAIYLAGSLTIAHVYWHWERGILLLREAIAHALLARTSLPPELAGPRARREPNYRRLGALVFALLGLIEIVTVAPAFLGDSALASESLESGLIIAAGVIAAILFYVVGETVLTALHRSPPKDGPHR